MALERVRSELTVSAYRAGATLARVAPRPVALATSSLLGRGVSLASPDRRRIVTRNLRRIYGPELEGAKLREAVERTFDSYARYYYDSFRLPSLTLDQIRDGIVVEGIEHLEAAITDDEVGPILALPHLGGWEWAAAWIAKVRGWPLAAVVEALEPPELFQWFLDFREALGMNIIPLGPDAASRVAAAVKAREVVCLLSDRDLSGDGAAVTFFGEDTTLPAGPAVMALRHGCRILPTAVYFREGDGVVGVVRPPLDTTRRGPRLRDDIEAITQRLADELEILIRRAPEQWHLMQPNWPSDRSAT